jgi:DNA-binding transcriptional LysR family regulator
MELRHLRYFRAVAELQGFREAARPLHVVLGLCDRAGFAPRVVNEADLMQIVFALVEAGEGVALVPGCVSNLRGSGVVFRPVEPDTVRIPLVMVWPTARESAAPRSFLGVVREHAENIERMVSGGAGG